MWTLALPTAPDVEDSTCPHPLPHPPAPPAQLHPGLGHVSACGCSSAGRWARPTLLEPKTRREMAGGWEVGAPRPAAGTALAVVREQRAGLCRVRAGREG